MKKLCLLTAIVCAAVMLFSSCGLSRRRAAKVELYIEEYGVITDECTLFPAITAETMEEAIKSFADRLPGLYNSEEMRQAVANYGSFYIPDNGDEIIAYEIGAREDDITVIVRFMHGETELNLVKCCGDPNALEMQVGDKTVNYSINEVEGEDIITSIFYKSEGGDILQIFKAPEGKVDKSVQFTKEEITALGEDFFNFKPEELKDCFGEDYFAASTEDIQE